jgi:glutaredoxin 3
MMVLHNTNHYCLVYGERLSTGQDVDTFVEQYIRSADVVVFAKSYCPYCRKTHDLLDRYDRSKSGHDITMQFLNLDTLPERDGPSIQMELLQKTGQKTVPNIFIHTKHIGGNSDLQQLYHDGQLDLLLLMKQE